MPHEQHAGCLQERELLAARALQHCYASTGRRALRQWWAAVLRSQKQRAHEALARAHQVAASLCRAMGAWQAGVRHRRSKRAAAQHWSGQAQSRALSLWRTRAQEQKRQSAQTRLVSRGMVAQCLHVATLAGITYN